MKIRLVYTGVAWEAYLQTRSWLGKRRLEFIYDSRSKSIFECEKQAVRYVQMKRCEKVLVIT